MGEITKTEGRAIRSFAPLFSEKLTDALRDAERGGRTDLLPLLDPPEVEEARAALPAFEAALAGISDPTEIERMLGKLALVTVPRQQTDPEAKASVAVYVELLSDLPGDILSGAMRAIAMTSTFYPTPAEIRKAAWPELAARRWKLFCLKRMIEKHEQEWEPPLRPEDRCSPEEARRIVADLFEKQGIRPDSKSNAERRTRSKRRAGVEEA